MNTHEVYISVDVESSGPIPGEYSLLSIGACSIYEPNKTFHCEIKPVSPKHDPEALAVTGLSLIHLERYGLEPETAMKQFASWAESCKKHHGDQLVFVGFNAAFDWSFVNYYFHRFSHANPFGFAALDIKALYMGTSGVSWSDTKSSKMDQVLKPQHKGTHNALEDALYQAELFRLIRQTGEGSN